MTIFIAIVKYIMDKVFCQATHTPATTHTPDQRRKATHTPTTTHTPNQRRKALHKPHKRRNSTTALVAARRHTLQLIRPANLSAAIGAMIVR